jgi:hypothetical protein
MLLLLRLPSNDEHLTHLQPPIRQPNKPQYYIRSVARRI